RVARTEPILRIGGRILRAPIADRLGAAERVGAQPQVVGVLRLVAVPVAEPEASERVYGRRSAEVQSDGSLELEPASDAETGEIAAETRRVRHRPERVLRGAHRGRMLERR